MRTSRQVPLWKLLAVPALFTMAAAAIFVGHVVITRKQAAKQAVQTKIIEDPFLAENAVGGKLRDLYQAARKGDLSARLDLAKRYANGVDVAKNEARAFAYFRAIADQYAQVDPRSPAAAKVSEAFRHLAEYYRRGVASAKLKADHSYAVSLLRYGASYFGDPAAQFELAKALLEGKGVSKNPRLAIQWLDNARRKGYAPAQALLGNLLWRGEGVKQLRGEGLGLLALARVRVSKDDAPWVTKMFERARLEASPSEVLEANAYIAHERYATHAQLTDDTLVSLSASTSAISASVGQINDPAAKETATTEKHTATPEPQANAAPPPATVAETASTPPVDLGVREVRFGAARASMVKSEPPAEEEVGAQVHYRSTKTVSEP